MADSFDPYHRWLGIPPEDQPPDHYRLLGIAAFESDRQVIDSVAMRHISFLQEITDPACVQQAQQLLNELAAARRCLLDPSRKAEYDAALQQGRGPAPPPAQAPGPCGVTSLPGGSPAAGPAEPGLPASDRGPGAAGLPRIRGEASPVARRKRRPAREYVGRARPVAAAVLGRRGRIALAAVAGFAIMIAVGNWPGRSGSERAADGQPAKLSLSAPPPAPPAAPPPSVAAKVAGAGLPVEFPPLESHRAEPAGTAEPLPVRELVGGVDQLPEVSVPQVAESASAPPAVPLQIEGLLLWLDAADQASLRFDAAGILQRWEDKSGGGYVAAPEGTARPRLVSGGLGSQAVVEFSGSASLSVPRTAAPLNLGSRYTLAYVSAGGSGPLLSKGSGESAGSLILNGSAGLRIGGAGLAAGGDDGRLARLRTIVADEDALRWLIDGDEHQVHAGGRHAIKNNNVLRIGGGGKRGDAAAGFEGLLAELLIYDRTLDEQQLNLLQGYLRDKWFGDEVPPPLPAAAIQPPEEGQDSGDSPADMLSTPSEREREPAADSPAEPVVGPAEQKPAPDASNWEQGFVPLEPNRLEASAASQLQLLDSGSVLADGAARQDEVYRIAVAGPQLPVTALRLEALPHPSLPGSGPGWGNAGRFSLAEIRVRVEPAGAAESPQPVVLYMAVADDPAQARRLIDDNDATSWTVSRRGERVVFTFLPSVPIECPPGSQLSVHLHQRENLGCFRLSATAAPEPLNLPDQPPPEAVVAAAEDGTLFVNLGGEGYVDSAGNRWEKSPEFAGQGFGHENGMVCSPGPRSYPQQPWAETAIRGLTAFRAVVPDGSYDVTLCFCEQWTSDPGGRLFIAVIERGAPHARTQKFHGPGMQGPWLQTLPRVAVKDGQLDIEFQPFGEKSRAILNAIVIRPRSPSGRR